MITYPLFQVDAFTKKPFSGNPAAVCLLTVPQLDVWMQAVASEMNLSETAFLLPEADGYRLRWFTPLVEVDLCGHATLASAHILWEKGLLKPDQEARFFSRSGLLTARQTKFMGESWIELNFPIKPLDPAVAPQGLEEALGATALFIGRNQFDYLVEVENETEVRNLHPDFTRLSEIPARGVIVTSRADDPNIDFVSRFFAPRVGVNEDPVTGSAHCCLTPFWASRLGKNELDALQVSRRGGVLRVKLDGERVHIAGQAVTVLHGELVGEPA
jgi:PhzF family phenazine biosynthesis protein